MNYFYCKSTSSNSLYRYKDKHDYGELYTATGWVKSVPPAMVDCLVICSKDWQTLTEFEAIEQFPEAFQDENDTLHIEQQGSTY